MKIETMQKGSEKPNYIQKSEKDRVLFVTKEDHATPSTVTLPEPEKPNGLILEDGSINWGCPCLGGMAVGPCGVQFREAFSCFHYSSSEPKGSDCMEVFSQMQECMQKYPKLYDSNDRDDELENVNGGKVVSSDGETTSAANVQNVRDTKLSDPSDSGSISTKKLS